MIVRQKSHRKGWVLESGRVPPNQQLQGPSSTRRVSQQAQGVGEAGPETPQRMRGVASAAVRATLARPPSCTHSSAPAARALLVYLESALGSRATRGAAGRERRRGRGRFRRNHSPSRWPSRHRFVCLRSR